MGINIITNFILTKWWLYLLFILWLWILSPAADVNPFNLKEVGGLILYIHMALLVLGLIFGIPALMIKYI